MWLFFCTSVVLVVAAVLYMLHTLPAKGVPTQVKVVTGSAWLTTLLVCCIVPIDVFSTLSSRNPPAIEYLWNISYWSTQLLTWLLIPLYMGYADAGDFTWKGRMLASLKFNGMFLALQVTVGCIGVFWAVSESTLSLSTLPSLAMQLANTFGLFCVLTLLGHGLVAVPRHLWKRSIPEQELRHQLYRLGRIMDEKLEAQELLQASIRKVNSTKRALGNNEYESHARIDAMLDFIRAHIGPDSEMFNQAGTVHQGLQYTDELPKLHKEIRRDVYWVGAINVQADIIVREACRLTQIVRASAGEPVVADASGAVVKAPTSWQRVTWRATVWLLPWLLKAAAVSAAALSCIILWCEITVTFGQETLSPLSHIISFTSNEFLCQTYIALFLLYVITCTYSALFAINMGALYSLLPAASSSFSLLFNGNLVARFAAPLCFNYLHVLSMDRPTKEGYYTVFAQRMGLQSDDDVAIPFLGTSFNRYAPAIILLVVGLTLVNAFGRFYLWLSSYLVFLPQAYNENEDESSECQQFVAEGQRVVDHVLESAAGNSEAVDHLVDATERSTNTAGRLIP